MGNFQTTLKSLRTAQGLTQDELAKILQVSRSTIGMYENGSREPDYETLNCIADFFNVNIDYLLGRTTKTIPVIHNITSRRLELELLAHFNKLNDAGKTEATKRVAELTFLPRYAIATDTIAQVTSSVLVNAAHERTDIEITEEMRKHDEDIMDDPDF